LQFSHPYFVRDHPELLNNIRRKATTQGRVVPADSNAVSVQSKELSRVLDEVRQLRERQSSMEGKMSQLMKYVPPIVAFFIFISDVHGRAGPKKKVPGRADFQRKLSICRTTYLTR
jgi:hypothetical protein